MTCLCTPTVPFGRIATLKWSMLCADSGCADHDSGRLQVVAAATEPLTERPATEFPEGITACSLSADASGWLAGHAFQPHTADGAPPLANGLGEATYTDSFVLVARCAPMIASLLTKTLVYCAEMCT